MTPASSGVTRDGLPALREVIEEMGLRPKKRLGQNFIHDLNLTRRIARIAGDLSRTTVVEVGPGPGGLTRALLTEGAAQVIAVERDERCLPALAQIASRWPGRLTVQPGDALETDWAGLVGGARGPRAIVSNLPYNIATILLVGWLETEPWPPWFDRMVLMFQKEVAERITSAPGTKAYGRLAVISQWRTRPRIALTLGPEAFTPPPRVASAVVEFLPRASPQPACSARALGEVTAAAFGQRRKMLRSSLRRLVDRPEALLEVAGIAPNLRAEQLDVRAFATLARVFESSRAGRD